MKLFLKKYLCDNKKTKQKLIVTKCLIKTCDGIFDCDNNQTNQVGIKLKKIFFYKSKQLKLCHNSILQIVTKLKKSP